MNDTLHQSALTAIHDDPQGDTWSSEVSEHVRGCGACQKTLSALRSMVSSMRRRTTTVQAPANLVATVCRNVQAEQSKSLRRRQKIVELAIPVALAAGLLIGFLLPHDGNRAPVVTGTDMTALLDDVLHDRFLLDDMSQTIEFSSGNPSTASAWLASNLGFEVNLPAAPRGWELRGARLWHTVGALSAMAEYERDGELVTLFARPKSGVAADALPADAPEGATMSWRLESADHRGVAWVDGDLVWVAVATGTFEDVSAWIEDARTR